MDKEVINLIAYHGTSNEGEKGILHSKSFKVSENDDEWIGHGIYFFYKDKAKEHSRDWATNVKNFKFYSIIEVQIYVDCDKILNLNEEEMQELFHKYRLAKIAEYKKRGIFIDQMNGNNAKILDCMTVNDIADKGQYQVVCQRRYIEFRKRKPRDKLIYSNIPNCNIMSVRDPGVIDKDSLKCIERSVKK